MATDSKINFSFPCGHFRAADSEDPMSGKYQDANGAIWPRTAHLFWEKLKFLEKETVAASSGGTLTGKGLIQITCLNEDWSVDTEKETVTRVNSENTKASGEWDQQVPFVILVYLASAQNEPPTYDMVLPRDLFKGFDLFRNSLDKDIHWDEETFGRDGEAFLSAAKSLGGERIEGGDASVRFHVFPKFPVDYILWLGDKEFTANLTILVDRGAPQHVSADTIIVALNQLSRRLYSTL